MAKNPIWENQYWEDECTKELAAEKEYLHWTEVTSHLLPSEAAYSEDFAYLDDWDPRTYIPEEETPRERLHALGPWADKEFNEKGRKEQRKEFLDWLNGQEDLIRERLALRDCFSVKSTLEYMELIDRAILDWHNHSYRPLFRNPPSVVEELSKEYQAAWKRNRPTTDSKIALGEFVRVRLKGIIHILPPEALVEFPQLKECLV